MNYLQFQQELVVLSQLWQEIWIGHHLLERGHPSAVHDLGLLCQVLAALLVNLEVVLRKEHLLLARLAWREFEVLIIILNADAHLEQLGQRP